MSHMQLPSPHVTIPHFLAGRSSGTNRHIEWHPVVLTIFLLGDSSCVHVVGNRFWCF
jgi:hypothetical protein